jgi:PTH1 family peptidyl-tRNA hydrolase
VALFGRVGKGAPADWLVVGLGNPGPKYEGTRHNVGEAALRVVARRHDVTLKGGRDNALAGEARIADQRVVLAFPITYMNDSGQAVGALVRRHRITDPGRLVVIHDELDLDPGTVRVKDGGGLAGHNGLRSITQHLSTQDYVRVRIGVGKPAHKDLGANHVLHKLSTRERESFDVAITEAADAAETIVTLGVDTAMQRFNGRR